MDVKGKVLVVLANDPQPTADKPGRFRQHGHDDLWQPAATSTRLCAVARAGAGALHTDASAQTAGRWPARGRWAEQFQLDRPGAGLAMQRLDPARAAASRLFAAARQDLAALRAEPRLAFKRRCARLAHGAGAQHHQPASKRFSNGGRGAEAPTGAEGEYGDLLRPHWDHLGSRVTPGRPRIFNSAVDNASGTATPAGSMARSRRCTQPARHADVPVGLRRRAGACWAAAATPGCTVAAGPHGGSMNLDTLNFVGQTLDIRPRGLSAAAWARRSKAVAAQIDLSVAPPEVDWRLQFP